MVILLTVIHVLVCFVLLIVVLVQSGQAADLAGAFGGMGSQTTFGPRSQATPLSRATTIGAAIFMITSLTLSIMTTRGSASSGSVLEHVKQPAATQPVQKPAAPGAATPIKPGPGNSIPVQIPPPPAQAPAQQQTPAQSKAPAQPKK